MLFSAWLLQKTVPIYPTRRKQKRQEKGKKKEKRNHQVETQDSYICVDLDIQEFNSPDKQHLVNIHSVPKTEMNEA